MAPEPKEPPEAELKWSKKRRREKCLKAVNQFEQIPSWLALGWKRDGLIPIRLDIDLHGKRFRDSFTWSM